MSSGDVSRHAWLHLVARQLSQWGLSAPAVFFLELHRPFSFAASQLAIFFQPMLGFWLGDDNAQRFSHWLSDEQGWDQLIQALEHGEHS